MKKSVELETRELNCQTPVKSELHNWRFRRKTTEENNGFFDFINRYIHTILPVTIPTQGSDNVHFSEPEDPTWNLHIELRAD